MLSPVYKCCAFALIIFTSPLSASSAKDYFSKLKTAVLDNDVNNVHQLLQQNRTDWLTKKRGWEIASLAAEKGNLNVIQYVAEHELSIFKKTNEKNETIGHVAAEYGHTNITEYFLKRMAPFWKTGSQRKSLLGLAAKIGDLNWILSCRVSPYSDDLESMGKIAAQNGHLDIACYMAIEKSWSHCNHFKDIISTALKNSCKRDPETLELLEKLTDEWGAMYYLCPSIVELALSANNTELIEYLAEKKSAHFLKCERRVYYDDHRCGPMEIAFERNLVTQNFLDRLEKGNGTIQGYIGESKQTICHLAAKHGRLNVIRFLAEKNASILERVDNKYRTVAEIAAEQGYKDIARYAVRQKPLTRVTRTWDKYLNWQRRYTTALHLGIAENWIDMDTLKYVVEREGADIITITDDYDGATVAHTAAIRIDNMEILQYLVTKNPSVLSVSDSSGNTVLHILARGNELNETSFTFFVDMGAPLVVKNCDGDTVGHILAEHGHSVFVEYLAEKDPSILKLVDKAGDTVLHILARGEEISVKNLEFFVDKGASVLTYNNLKENIPTIATKNGDLEILRFVVERETSVFEGNASVGIKMAEIAASHGHSSILEFIVNKKPILLADRPSILFQLPNESQVLDALQYLIEACETKVKKWDRTIFENEVLKKAFEYDYPGILRYMKYDVNMMNEKGEPLIFTAVRRERPNIFHFLADDERTNLTALDRDGNNILFIAAMNHDLEKIQYILDTLKAPIDIEWRNKEGNSLLHVAVHEVLTEVDGAHELSEESRAQSTRHDIDVIKYLVEEKHARTDTSGHENMTALHCATRRGNYFISNYLLDHGARPKLRDANGFNFWRFMHFPTPDAASVGTSTSDTRYYY